MSKRLQDGHPRSLIGLLAQALLVGAAMLLVRLLIDGNTRASWSYAGLFAVVWFLLGLHRVRRRATTR